jgi:hypothetical protein
LKDEGFVQNCENRKKSVIVEEIERIIGEQEGDK